MLILPIGCCLFAAMSITKDVEVRIWLHLTTSKWWILLGSCHKTPWVKSNGPTRMPRTSKWGRLKLFLLTLSKFRSWGIEERKSWKKICVTSNSLQIWTVKWPHIKPITGNFSALFVPSPLGRGFSIWKISMHDSIMADDVRKCFILLKIGAKSFGIGIQDICKVSVSNFGTIRWLLRLKIVQKQEFVCLRADFQFA